MRRFGYGNGATWIVGGLVVGVLVVGGLAAGGALAADHREAPLIQMDATADITDVYAFTSPNNPDNLVMIMAVNPFSAPTEAITYNFSPDVLYQFNIDNDSDNISDYEITARVSDPLDGPQKIRVAMPAGEVQGLVTQPTEEPEANERIVIEGNNGEKVFAGPADDPFFFDVVGFFRLLAGTGTFTGTDGFAGFNVSAIAVELPYAQVYNGTALQIWASTQRQQRTLRRASHGLLEKNSGPLEQVERMGNPAIGTALIPGGLKDFYNIGQPENDADDFAASIVASLQSLGTNEENINILASVAVPDTLKLVPEFDTTYPNGRRLDDDVIDTLLFFIFNQTPVPDGVSENDKAFEETFPYLATPHQAP